MFQIVKIDPVHCQITDGIVGSKAQILPMTYHRADYARALAGVLSRRDYEECGDATFRVIDVDLQQPGRPIRYNSPFGRELPQFDDEIPF